MKTKQIIGLVIAGVLFIAIGVSSVLTNAVSEKILGDSVETLLSGSYEFNAPSGDYIGIVRIEGTIQQQSEINTLTGTVGYQHTTTMEYIDQLMKDSHNKGILLYVDSPGGTVYESEEMYRKLVEYKEETGRPIWDYMSHYAASGGYMISMAADTIYANTNTMTGSIGVIMSGYDLTGLYEKLGIRYISITSGENKDSSQMTEEQMAIYQEQVNEYYQNFVEIVAEGRGMSEDAVKVLADGRTYTAKQALENGLIDSISSYEEMKEIMSQELGTSEFYELETPVSVFASLFAKVEAVMPKSEAQILTETAAKMESGVPMYYAEGLQ